MGSYTPVSAQSDKIVEIQRDAQFWYKNGDTVLVASHKVAFNIYIELLSRESTVFRDLVNQDVPQPEKQETMDNCPVVHLTDEPEDVRIFLSLIYDGWRVRNHRTWPVVKAMITLGDKYHTTEFYNTGIDMLKIAYRPWLDGQDEPDDQSIQFTPEDAISMANVTRDLDPALYAVALYLCSLLPVATLTSGLLRGGGLQPEILYRCLQGREHFEMTKFDRIRSVLDVLPQVATCTKDRCRDVVAQLRASDFVTSRARMDHINSTTNDIMRVPFWTKILVELQATGVCGRCIVRYVERVSKVRKALRDSLQDRFGLGETTTEQ